MIAAYRQTQVSWLGLRVGPHYSHFVLFYIHHMNHVKSCNDLSHNDSTINIV